jgi:vacuolar protein sorting-associated protein 35
VLQANKSKEFQPDSVTLLVRLLSVPLEKHSLAILDMSHYPKMMDYLQIKSRKLVAVRIIKALLRTRKALDSVEIVTKLCDFIRPILEDLNKDESVDDKHIDPVNIMSSYFS